MYLIGIAISLFSLWFYIAFCGGNWAFYLDIFTLIILLSVQAAVLTATNSFRVFAAGMRAVISPKKQLSEDMRGRAASLFRLLSKASGITAAICFLISMTLIFHSLDWSYSERTFLLNSFSTNLACALIPPMYGLWFIAAVFEPAVFLLKKRPSGKG